MNQPKHYTKTFNGRTVIAYNDSGVEWVVYPKDKNNSPMRFDRKKFTMKHAMEFYTEIYGGV